jgi:hypothetical protein
MWEGYHTSIPLPHNVISRLNILYINTHIAKNSNLEDFITMEHLLSSDYKRSIVQMHGDGSTTAIFIVNIMTWSKNQILEESFRTENIPTALHP